MKVLAALEGKKKKKYLEPCLEPCQHFTPFVLSTNVRNPNSFSKNYPPLSQKSGRNHTWKYAASSTLE
jgi:hypothetical protein